MIFDALWYQMMWLGLFLIPGPKFHTLIQAFQFQFKGIFLILLWWLLKNMSLPHDIFLYDKNTPYC